MLSNLMNNNNNNNKDNILDEEQSMSAKNGNASDEPEGISGDFSASKNKSGIDKNKMNEIIKKYRSKYFNILNAFKKIPNINDNHDLHYILRQILKTPGFAVLSNAALMKFVIDIVKSYDDDTNKMRPLAGLFHSLKSIALALYRLF